MRGRAVRGALAVVVAAVGLAVAGPAGGQVATPSVPLPAVEGPVPVTATSRPFIGSPLALGALGYVEREFLVGGVAQPYAYEGSGVATVATGTAEAYRTRVLVRAPADPARYRGVAVVELLNPTASFDLDIVWSQSRDHLIREGWAWVGVTIQPLAVEALQRFDPTRYGSLDLRSALGDATPTAGVRDPSLTWDAVGQVGALLESASPSNPLPGTRQTIASGWSQSASYLVTYVNGVHPRHRVFDAFLLGARGGGATPIHLGAPPATLEQRVIQPAGVPVLTLQTETDVLGSLPVRRADADTPGDRFRLWEVPGAAHNDIRSALDAVALIQRDVPALAGAITTPCAEPITEFPVRHQIDAGLAGLSTWAAGGPPLSSVGRIATTGEGPAAAIVRDQAGNALGGLRTPYVDVPAHTYGPRSTGPAFCVLTGWQRPLDPAIVGALHGNELAYQRRVSQAVDGLVAQGLVTPAGAAAIRAESLTTVIRPRTATVARGDTLWGIARRSLPPGTPATLVFARVRELVGLNPELAANPNRLRPGQVLRTP